MSHDKTSSLATSADLLLTEDPTQSPIKPPESLYSLALSLAPPTRATNTSSWPSTAPTPKPPSLLSPLSSKDRLNTSPLSSSVGSGTSTGPIESSVGRRGPISVSWVDFPPLALAQPPGKQGTISSRDALNTLSGESNSKPMATSSTSFPSSETMQQQPTSGETTLTSSGIVHLFRHAFPRPGIDASNTASKRILNGSPSKSAASYLTASVVIAGSPPDESDGTLACVLAVPSWMTPADFLQFVSGSAEDLECLRMIRDVSPSRSIVLLKFRLREEADAFIETFNGKPFTAFEPEQCHCVRISSVLTHYSSPSQASEEEAPPPVPTPAFPIQPESERLAMLPATDVLKDAYELPTCPVCLERMDSSVTGLVTVPCDHTFHCQCLAQWSASDSRCPVCRYSSTPTPPGLPDHSAPANNGGGASPSSCASCSTTESLWICLICGNVGCGRYSEGKHAQKHAERHGHIYALELETQRVWNYEADEYVHRLLLLQDKSSKGGSSGLVELPSSSSTYRSSSSGTAGPGGGAYAPAAATEKLEAISLEYSHLLYGQLSAQRQYYSALHESLLERNVQLERMLAREERSKEKERIRRLERELADEREMNRGLMENVRGKGRELEEAKRELELERGRTREKEDEVRDLMFFLEAREKIESADKEEGGGTSALGEMQGGSIELPPTTTPATLDEGTPKKKKKGKGKK